MTKETGCLIVQTVPDADALMARVRESADYDEEWLIGQTGDPLAKSRAMKFETVGLHPINHRPISVVEQIDQTWTFTAALAATRQLLALRPDAGVFRLAPSVQAELPLDIMSEQEGLVGV